MESANNAALAQTPATGRLSCYESLMCLMPRYRQVLTTCGHQDTLCQVDSVTLSPEHGARSTNDELRADVAVGPLYAPLVGHSYIGIE